MPTFPQFLQWWRRRTTVKAAAHDIHLGARISGIHGGGASTAFSQASSACSTPRVESRQKYNVK